jgi:ParB family chromosome partitioning protein
MKQNPIEQYLRSIKLTDIDLNDRRFVITYGEDLAPLTGSIREIGVVNPPVLKEGKTYTIVTGYKRIAACKELGIKEISAFITDKSDKDCFFLSFHDNMGTRELNDIEKAETIKRLLELVGEEKTLGEFLPLMGLGNSTKVLEDYASLLGLEKAVKDGVVNDHISMRNSLMLLEFPEDERTAIFSLITGLHLSKSKQREVITYIKEISKREHTSVLSIVDKLNRTREDTELTVPEKTEKIRMYLRKRRNPVLSDREKEFGELVKQMTGQIKISSSPFFEGDDLRVEFRFRDRNQLRKQIGDLKQIADSDSLDRLLKLL